MLPTAVTMLINAMSLAAYDGPGTPLIWHLKFSLLVRSSSVKTVVSCRLLLWSFIGLRKCRIQCFWSLTRTRDKKAGYLPRCYDFHFISFFNQSLVRPSILWKCNAKSLDQLFNSWMLEHPWMQGEFETGPCWLPRDLITKMNIKNKGGCCRLSIANRVDS